MAQRNTVSGGGVEGDVRLPDAAGDLPEKKSPELIEFFDVRKVRRETGGLQNFPHFRELAIASRFMSELTTAVAVDPRLDVVGGLRFSRLIDPEFQADFYRRFSEFSVRRIAPLIDDIFTFLQPFLSSSQFREKFPVNQIKPALYIAAYIAFFIHDGQVRKGEYEFKKEPVPRGDRKDGEPAFTFTQTAALPYIEHCISAAADLVHVVGAPYLETIIVTFLHDIIEDILKGFFKGTVPNTPESADVFCEHCYCLLETVFPKNQFPHLVERLRIVSKDARAWPSFRDKRARAALDMLYTFLQDPSLNYFSGFLIRLADRLRNQRSVESLQEDRQEAMTRETQYVYLPLALLLEMPSVVDELQDYLFSAHIGFNVRELFRRWSEEYLKQQHRVSHSRVGRDRLGVLGSFVAVFQEKMKDRGFDSSQYVLMPRARPLRHYPRKSAGWKSFGEEVASGRAFSDEEVASFSRGLRTYWRIIPLSENSEIASRIALAAKAVFMELLPAKPSADYDDSSAFFGQQFTLGKDISDDRERSNYGVGAYKVYEGPEKFYRESFGSLPYAVASFSSEDVSSEDFRAALFDRFSRTVGSEVVRLKALFARLDEYSSPDPARSRIAHTRRKTREVLGSNSKSPNQFSYSPQFFDRLVRLVEQQVFTLFAKKHDVTFVFQYPDGRAEEQSVSIPEGCNFSNGLLYLDPFSVGQRPFNDVTLERRVSHDSPEVARTPKLFDKPARFSLENNDRVVLQMGDAFSNDRKRRAFLKRFFDFSEANFRKSVFPALAQRIRKDSGP